LDGLRSIGVFVNPAGRRWILLASLGAGGAVLGAAAAVLVIVLLTAVVTRSAPGLFDLRMAATWGAVLGAVLTPTILWTLLRHVPLGRVVGVTVTGMVVGALMGVLAAMPHVGAALGFLAALAWLKWQYPRGEARGSPSDAI
jgi:hypothetical protein